MHSYSYYSIYIIYVNIYLIYLYIFIIYLLYIYLSIYIDIFIYLNFELLEIVTLPCCYVGIHLLAQYHDELILDQDKEISSPAVLLSCSTNSAENTCVFA